MRTTRQTLLALCRAREVTTQNIFPKRTGNIFFKHFRRIILKAFFISYSAVSRGATFAKSPRGGSFPNCQKSVNAYPFISKAHAQSQGFDSPGMTKYNVPTSYRDEKVRSQFLSPRFHTIAKSRRM